MKPDLLRPRLPDYKPQVSLSKRASLPIDDRRGTVITSETIEKARQVIKDAGTGWNIRELERQFYEYASSKGQPASMDKAFVGFVRKKVQKRP